MLLGCAATAMQPQQAGPLHVSLLLRLLRVGHVMCLRGKETAWVGLVASSRAACAVDVCNLMLVDRSCRLPASRFAVAEAVLPDAGRRQLHQLHCSACCCQLSC